MRGLLEAGAEMEGSTAQHQLDWLIGHYQQVCSAADSAVTAPGVQALSSQAKQASDWII